MATIHADFETLSEGESVGVCWESSLDSFHVRLLFTYRAVNGTTFTKELRMSVKRRFGHEQHLEQEDGAHDRGRDPEDVLVALNTSNVASAQSANEATTCEEDGIDGLSRSAYASQSERTPNLPLHDHAHAQKRFLQ